MSKRSRCWPSLTDVAGFFGSLERASVHVGDVLSVRGLAFRLLFVVGMAEKTFPRSPSQDPILLDREREILNAGGADLPLRGGAVDEEAFLFALLRGAAPDLVLSYSRIEPVDARPRQAECPARQERAPQGQRDQRGA